MWNVNFFKKNHTFELKSEFHTECLNLRIYYFISWCSIKGVNWICTINITNYFLSDFKTRSSYKYGFVNISFLGNVDFIEYLKYRKVLPSFYFSLTADRNWLKYPLNDFIVICLFIIYRGWSSPFWIKIITFSFEWQLNKSF